MSHAVQYVIGLILMMSALLFISTQPLLSAVIALCGVITLGRLLWKLLNYEKFL